MSGALLLLLVVFFGWQAWRAGSALSQIRDESQQITDALNQGDLTAADQHADALRADAHRASSSTGVLWSIGRHLPLVGHSIGAVQTSARVLDQIASRSLPTLLSLAGEAEHGDLRPSGGRIDLTAVHRHAPAIRAAARAVAPAADEMAAVRDHGLIWPLNKIVPDLQQQVAQAKGAIDATASAFEVMPTMLGEHRTRRYLLLVQNPAEIRATGGLPGSVAVLSARDGRISMGRQGDATLLSAAKAPVPPTREEAALYGPQLGGDLRDVNFNPDFARVATMAAGLAQRKGIKVDGVFAIDPVALAYVLQGTGPVRLADGTDLTTLDVIPYLLNAVYQNLADPAAQNTFFAQAARRTFNALVTGQGDQVRAIRGLVIAAGEHRVLAWSPIPSVDRAIGRNQLSGALPGNTGRTAQVGIYYNDGVAGKIEFYLRQRTTAQSLGCHAGVQRIQVTTTLRSTVPGNIRKLSYSVAGNGDYAKRGHILMQMALYSPWHGHIDQVTVDGRDETATAGRQFGQQVGFVGIDLAPGASITVESTMTTGAGQTGNIKVTSTPGLELTPDPATFTTTCG